MQFLQLRSGSSGAPFIGNADQDTLLWDDTAKGWYVGPGGGGGAVVSVFGRNGVVVAQTGDYDSDQIVNVSSVPGASVSDALESLAAAAGVVSVFGRTGVVVAAANDYTASQITGGMQQPIDAAARLAIPTASREVGMTVYEVATDTLWRLIGGIANANWVDVTINIATTTAAGLVPALGAASTILQVNAAGTAAAWVQPLTWAATAAAPTIQQAADNTAGVTAKGLTIAAQNATGTGATVGGFVSLASGTGATPGELRLLVGSTKVGSFQISANDYLAFGVTPANSGVLRLPAGTALITHAAFAGGALVAFKASTTSGNVQTFGAGSAGGLVEVDGSDAAGTALKTNGVTRFIVGSTGAVFSGPNWTIAAASVPAGALWIIGNSASGSAPPGNWTFRAMGSTNGTAGGADINLQGGRFSGAALSGRVRLQLNQDDTAVNMWTMVEIAHLATTPRRVLSLLRTVSITTTEMPANTGDLVAYLGNAAVVPSADAVSGAIIYADGGKPAFRYNGTNLRLDGTSASASAGGGAAVPATVLGFKEETLNGTTIKVPYFAA